MKSRGELDPEDEARQLVERHKRIEADSGRAINAIDEALAAMRDDLNAL